MKIKNIISQLKSTLLGLAFIAVGIYILVNQLSSDYYIVGGLLVGGTLLLFTPDRFIEQLEKFVFGKVLFKQEENNNGNQSV